MDRRTPPRAAALRDDRSRLAAGLLTIDAVEGEDVIRIGSGLPRDTPPRPKSPAVAAGLLLVGVLASLGIFRGSGSAVSEDTVPDLGPDQLELARLVVLEFATAWNRGDIAAVDALIAEDWRSIVLPGLLDPRFTAEDGRPALIDGISFLSGVAGISLGPCDAELAPPDAGTAAVVRCPEAAFDGRYLDAVARNIWDPPPSGIDVTETTSGIDFGIRGNRILHIDGGSPAFTPQAYCIWAEQTHPEAASLFDLACHPATGVADAGAHARLAEGFLAAGSPLPSTRLTNARLAAWYVDRFVEHHNIGDTPTALEWLSRRVPASNLPGFAGADAEPAMTDYLRWSARLVRIDAGECSVEYGGSHTIVTCPQMAVDGPLAGGPLPQPTRFTITSSPDRGPLARAFDRIVGVERLSDDLLPVEETCRELQSRNPAAAALAFAGDCRPVYTAEAAAALAAMLEDRWPGDRS